MADGVNIDWSLAKPVPDFIGDYQNAFEVGRKMAAQTQVQNALKGYSADPTGTAARVMQFDPALGAQLQANAQKATEFQQGQQDRQTGQEQAAAMASGNPESALSVPGASLENNIKVSQFIQSAHKDQLDHAAKLHEALATGAIGLIHNVPMPANATPDQEAQIMAERRAQAAHTLQGLGFSQQDISGIAGPGSDFSDAGLTATAQSSMKVSEQYQAAAEQRKEAETNRHNQVEEGQGRQRIGIEGAHLALDRTKFATEQAQRTTLSPDTASFIADRVLAGDPKALVGIGRGTQGSNDLRLIQNAVASKAAAKGMSGGDLAKVMQQFAGDTAAARTAGNLDAKLNIRSGEVDKFADLASQASQQVPRSSWQTFNRLVQLGQTETSDPKLKALLIQTQGLINARAAAIGQGQVHIGDQVEGRKLLSTADGPEAFAAAIRAFKSESHAARDAVTDYRHTSPGSGGGRLRYDAQGNRIP